MFLTLRVILCRFEQCHLSLNMNMGPPLEEIALKDLSEGIIKFTADYNLMFHLYLFYVSLVAYSSSY
jgi:hypothetical protein